MPSILWHRLRRCAQKGALYNRAMRIIARRTLLDFVDSLTGHSDQHTVKSALDAWFDEVRKARWASTVDVRQNYATAGIVTFERIVFNIKGNNYRLVVSVDVVRHIVWIKWIGTHKDYGRIDVTEVDHDH